MQPTNKGSVNEAVACRMPCTTPLQMARPTNGACCVVGLASPCPGVSPNQRAHASLHVLLHMPPIDSAAFNKAHGPCNPSTTRLLQHVCNVLIHSRPTWRMCHGCSPLACMRLLIKAHSPIKITYTPPPLHPHFFLPSLSYVGFGTAAIMAVLITNGPDNSLQGWAKPYALAELKEEDAVFEAYAADPEMQERVAAELRQHGAHADRCGGGDRLGWGMERGAC